MASRKTKPVVIDQVGGGYILKELTEEEFWELGRQRYYAALREVNEQARVLEERKKQAQMDNERTRIFNASISEQQQEKEAQSKSWQLDLHDFILDRGVRF